MHNEAMSRECIAIALSPEPDFIMGKCYAVHLGANGNLSTVIRRRLPNGYDFVDATFSSIRVCTPDAWTPYWVVCHKGKISVGIGRIPGKDCLGTLDDSLYDTLRPGQDAVRFVGLGNSVVGRSSQKFGNVKVRNLKVMPLPPSILAKGHLVMEEIAPHALLKLHARQNAASSVALETEEELLHEYENECAKARARAAKFGTVYVEPAPDLFFKWSEARRLRANPQRGFVTGFDTTGAEEETRRLARKERFAAKRKADDDQGEEGAKSDEHEMEQEGDNDDENEEDAGDQAGGSGGERPPLPVVEAWDNEDLVREFRVDPIGSPSLVQSSADASGDTTAIVSAKIKEEGDDMDLTVGVEAITAQNEAEWPTAVKTEHMDTDVQAEPVPEKIHLFAIDWAAFKQIRSDDIMVSFFTFLAEVLVHVRSLM